MKIRLVVRPQAELEALEAAEYYESQRVGLGLEFLDELQAAYEEIEQHPQFYFNIRPEKSQRRILVNRFPYLVVYEVNDREVIVLAVRHGRQKPFSK